MYEQTDRLSTYERFQSMTVPPPRRADAERNRDKIVAAAARAFAESDGEVSMAEIARRAGVGMATLYRNFPGRKDLLEALFTSEVDTICETVSAAGGESPGASLSSWLHRFHTFSMNKRRVALEILKHTDTSDPLFGNSRSKVLVAGRPLLDAAQKAGEIREDLVLEQMLDMVVAIATINGSPDYIEPILDAAIDGLRA